LRHRRLVLKSHFSDSGCSIASFGCAYVDFDRELCACLVKRAKMFVRCRREDINMNEMYFWDYTCEFFNLPDSLETAMGSQEVISVGQMPGSLAKQEAARTECDQMIVRHTGSLEHPDVVEFCWTAIPKHCDVYVITADLQWDRLVEMLPKGWLPDWAQIMKEVSDESSKPELPE